MTVLTGKQISKFRLITLYKGIELEGKGLRVSRGRSCLAIVNSEFGWQGSRKKILQMLGMTINSMPDTP